MFVFYLERRVENEISRDASMRETTTAIPLQIPRKSAPDRMGATESHLVLPASNQ
jgi:hypothetical protein